MTPTASTPRPLSVSAAAAGETPVDINTLHSKEIEGFVGSLYNATEVEELKNHADTVKYYEMPYKEKDLAAKLIGKIDMLPFG